MKVCVVRHHEIDTAALIADGFRAKGYEVEDVLLREAGDLPDPAGYEAAVVLGALWSVYDRTEVGAWIDAELDWVRSRDAARLPTLGICFGAQVMATAFGGRVEAMGSTELGWYESGTGDPSVIPQGPFFEFHGDHCLVSDEVDVLARNERCVQAFRHGTSLAVQFHPEVDPDILQAWLDAGARETVVVNGLDPQALQEETARREPEARQRAQHLVDLLLGATV